MKGLFCALLCLTLFKAAYAENQETETPVASLSAIDIRHPYLQNINWQEIDPFYKAAPTQLVEERYIVIPFQKQEGIAKRTLHIALGALVGYLAHEAGHSLVANAYGHDLDFDFRNDAWICEEDCSEDIKKIAIGGMLGQKAAAELILARDGPSNSFEEGVLIFDLLNSVGYTLANEVSGNYGDFQYLERNEQRVFGLTISAHGIFRSGRALWHKWRN